MRWAQFAGSEKWREMVPVAVLLGIGLAARTYQIDYNFDGDELFSARLASRPFGEVLSQSLEDRPHPPLYNILLYCWTSTFGLTERSARLLSVLFSAGFLLSAYALFRRAASPQAALGSLAILTVSPYFVYYGQQARPYALISLLSTTNMLAYLRMLEAPESSRRRFLWAVSCVALLYSQYLGGLLIAFEIAFAVCLLRANRLNILGYGLGAVVLIGPWLIGSMCQSLFHGTALLPHLAWMTRPGPIDVAWFYLGVFGTIPGVASRWLLVALACAALYHFYHAILSRKLALTASFLFVVAFGMPCVVYAVSVLGPQPVFESRQMIAAATAFVGAVGLFASTLKNRWVIAYFVVLSAWTAAGMPAAFPQTSKPPWSRVASDINERYGMQPVVALEEWVRDPLLYYRNGGRVRLWDELSDNEQRRHILLICRPSLNSRPGINDSPVRPRPVAKWLWGRQNEGSPFEELDLYEITPDSHGHPR